MGMNEKQDEWNMDNKIALSKSKMFEKKENANRNGMNEWKKRKRETRIVKYTIAKSKKFEKKNQHESWKLCA